MPRRMLVRLLRRLEASTLRVTDRVRLDLEAELVALMTLRSARLRPVMVLVHHDASGDADTVAPN